MNDSLSVVVPVRNAERSLAAQVGALLDVLPDLTSRFELILVDDGSTDQTIELARDLAARYPQVRLVRHGQSPGIESAAGTGLARAVGRTVYIQPAHTFPSGSELRRFWLSYRSPAASERETAAGGRIDPPQALPAPPRGLSFLGHLKELTLGERADSKR